MAQGEKGEICLHTDFVQGVGAAYNGLEGAIGDFRLFGNGINEADSGAFSIAVEGGGVRLTTTDEAEHAAMIGTNLIMSAGSNGPLVLETRVQFNNLDTKEAFIGFTDVAANATILEGGIGHGATTTLTLTASDICGFWLSAELGEDEMWHYIFNGGSAAGVTVSTTNETGIDAVAGEWDILRIEIDPNGTARWYINDVLKKTLVGAVSPTVNLGVVIGVEAKGTAVEEMDVQYATARFNRTWDR